MNLNCAKPQADSKTVLDVIDRGELDDYFFPADSTTSLFSPERLSTVYHPFTTTVNEYVTRGTPMYGGTVTFEIDSKTSVDLLLSSYVHVELDHWLSEEIQRNLQSRNYTYSESGEAPWTYINNMGANLIASASLQVDELEVERIDGDYIYMWYASNPSANTAFGIGCDGLGVKSPQDISSAYVYPTLNGTLACFLPFSYGRLRRYGSFPLASCKEGSVRIVVQFRPFHEVVRRIGGFTCTDSPLGRTFIFTGPSGEVVYTSSLQIPQPRRVSLMVYGALTSGKLRQALVRSPYEKIYREVYAYNFDEPLKYTINKVGAHVTIQLPLQLNNPCEEIFWVVRRKACVAQNEWNNYSAVRWLDYDRVYKPRAPLLSSGTIYINGQTITENEPESYYRRVFADAHKGGIVSYNEYIYGYVFSKEPGHKQPAGHVNMSRAQDIKLTLTVSAPDDGLDSEWSILVYAHCINWLRFENGIANRLYSS